jgi:hypothetical protein
MLENQLEELLTRAFTNALKIAFAPEVKELAAALLEDKPKRTRKPKEIEQPVAETTAVVETAQIAPAAAAPVEAPAVQEAAKVERRHVSAALITVAKTVSSTKAFEVLSNHGAKEVKDLSEAVYSDVVADCATLLGKTVPEVLALAPPKAS